MTNKEARVRDIICNAIEQDEPFEITTMWMSNAVKFSEYVDSEHEGDYSYIHKIWCEETKKYSNKIEKLIENYFIDMWSDGYIVRSCNRQYFMNDQKTNIICVNSKTGKIETIAIIKDPENGIVELLPWKSNWL